MEDNNFEGAPIKINRALRRALAACRIGPNGEKIPKRPFSNKANTCKRGKSSRAFNDLKKKQYGFLRRKTV